MDGLLRPHAVKAPSFVRDTTDFLSKVQAEVLPPQSLLVTMDVVSLYTNIPHAGGLDAIRHILQGDSEVAGKLTKFILEHNYFIFDERFFLQLSGTAMGTKMAPNYANAFMSYLEDNFLSTQDKIPSMYLRYIDDIFMIWPHGEASLKDFFNNFNAFHPTIKFTMDYGTSCHFLDVTASINGSSQIETTLYKKPTDRPHYLHPGSFHPPIH